MIPTPRSQGQADHWDSWLSQSSLTAGDPVSEEVEVDHVTEDGSRGCLPSFTHAFSTCICRHIHALSK